MNVNSPCTLIELVELSEVFVSPSTIWRCITETDYTWKFIRLIPGMRNKPAFKAERKTFSE